MTTNLHREAFDYAKELIGERRFIADDRDKWSKDEPAAERENQFIAEHGFREYGKWYLGIDPEQDENNKGRYRFPYGDFERVHRCALLSAESRAGQYKYDDIKAAAAHLHGMLEGAQFEIDSGHGD